MSGPKYTKVYLADVQSAVDAFVRHEEERRKLEQEAELNERKRIQVENDKARFIDLKKVYLTLCNSVKHDADHDLPIEYNEETYSSDISEIEQGIQKVEQKVPAYIADCVGKLLYNLNYNLVAMETLKKPNSPLTEGLFVNSKGPVEHRIYGFGQHGINVFTSKNSLLFEVTGLAHGQYEVTEKDSKNIFESMNESCPVIYEIINELKRFNLELGTVKYEAPDPCNARVVDISTMEKPEKTSSDTDNNSLKKMVKARHNSK